MPAPQANHDRTARVARRLSYWALPLLLVIALGGWLLWLAQANAHLEATSRTIDDVQRHYPNARVFRLTGGTTEAWECVLPSPGALAFNSGTPSCTFDSQGRRVAWTSDDGDDPSYARRVRALRDTPVTFETVAKEGGLDLNRAAP